MRSPHDARPLWVLRLVPSVRFGRQLTAATLLLILLAFFAVAGIFGAGSPGATPKSVSLFFAVIIAYIVPTYHTIVARCEAALDGLAPQLDASPQEIAGLRRAIAARGVRAQLLMLAIGIAAGIAHNVALSGPVGLVRGASSSLAYAAVACGTLLVWIVMTSVIAGLFHIALLFARLARRVRIDLLRLRALTPFADVAVISTLALIGAQAAFPLLWLDAGTSPIASIPGVVATGIPMLFLFALPLVPIHRAIAAAKAAELARLDAEVAATSGRGRHDAAHLAQVAPLLIYRREIESAQEWPFDTGASGRLALYLVIPPLTWVGAALIQHFVERAL
jgi:hypothetical protein